MKPESIRLGDYGRILFGRAPWTFAVESVLRIVFIYVLLVVAMRLMGKRMSSMANRNELAALVSLAAAVGPAMQDPARGLVPPAIVTIIVVIVQISVARRTMRSARFEHLTQGNVTTLIRDGELDFSALKTVALAPERVFAQLRGEEVLNLGAVRRTYLETNGAFTVLKFEEERPGLSLVPLWDEDLRRAQKTVDGRSVCKRCGHVEDEPTTCDRCGHREWEPAVVGLAEA